MKCEHKSSRVIAEGGFSGSVAVHPYTDENRAAHGNICVTHECNSCGAHRHVNVNQWHEEFSPWGPDRRTRERDAELQRLVRKSNDERRNKALALKLGIRILHVDRCGRVLIHLPDGRQITNTIHELYEAANQVNDEIAAVYKGVLLLVEEAKSRATIR